MSHVTGIRLDASCGTLVVVLADAGETSPSSPPPPPPPPPPIFAVIAPHIYHTNLSLVYLSIFFQMCKAHFIGYNPEVMKPVTPCEK